jgi:hypothetical protein
MPDKGLTLREAAIRSGVSEGAIRKRVARGTLRSEMGSDGRRYVWLDGEAPGADGGADGGADASATPESGALISEMHERITLLERELEEAHAANRENRRIIAALTQRIPEIEAPAEPRESSVTRAERSDRGEPRSSTLGAQEGAEPRSWWSRWFGG